MGFESFTVSKGKSPLATMLGRLQLSANEFESVPNFV